MIEDGSRTFFGVAESGNLVAEYSDAVSGLRTYQPPKKTDEQKILEERIFRTNVTAHSGNVIEDSGESAEIGRVKTY